MPMSTVDFTPATPVGAHRQSGKDAGPGRDGPYRRQFRARQCGAGRNHPHHRPGAEPERHRRLRPQWRSDGAESAVGADGAAERPVVPAFARAAMATIICCAAIRWMAPRSAAPAPTSSRAARRPRPSRTTTRRKAASISTPGSTGWRCAAAWPSRRSIWIWRRIGNRPSALTLSGNVTHGIARARRIAANLETAPAGAQGDADQPAMRGCLARGVFAFESMRGGATVRHRQPAGPGHRPGQSQQHGARFHRRDDDRRISSW